MCRLPSRRDIAVLLAAVLLAVLPVHSSAYDAESGGDDAAADDSVLREVLNQLDDDYAAVDGLNEFMREAAAFREHPADVNAAELAELLRVPFLDPASAVRIVARRDALGPVESLDALVARGCLSRETLTAVRPYLVARLPPLPEVSLPGVAPPKLALHDETLLEEARPEQASTFATPSVIPSQVTWELRLRAAAQERWGAAWGTRGVLNSTGTFARLRVYYADRFDLSVACEKDVGEDSLVDHTVASLVWHGVADAPECGPAISVGLGDFVGSWGQGLLLRSGGFPSVAAYPRRRDSVRRYDGAGETAARRGVFVTASRGKACIRAILARSALDAAIGEGGLATSIRTSGYHRTEGEREGASSLHESLVGVRLSLEQVAGLEVSASALRFGFSPELVPGDPVRQRFRFHGEELTAGGLDVRACAGELSAGCEVAMTSAGAAAALAAARLGRGSSRVKVGGAYLSRDYWMPLGGGVPGFSGGSNGVVGWVGAEYRAGSDWKAWAATRVARRPWRSYHSELPNGSTSVTVGGELRTKRDWRVAVETKVRACSDSEGDPPATVEGIVRRIRVSLRTEGSVPVTVSGWRVTSISGGREEGSLLAVALRIDGSITGRSSYTAGLTSMTSEGTVPPLIQYEPRLPGEFGLASLNVPGTRWYIRVQMGLRAGLGLSARLSGGPERGQTQFGLGLDVRG